MANRRMFSKEIIDSDMFLDMPLSSQCLYFHLSMRADDDGFVNNPKKIQRMVGGSDDDAKILLAKNFILSFESGVIVIKHWKLHNYIQKDRYKPSNYFEEKARLSQKSNGVYTMDTNCTPSIGKERLEKEIEKDNIPTQSQIDADFVSEYLANKILGVNPNAKVNPKSWQKDIEKAIRLDSRSKENLISAINWIYSKGTFWIPNIMSGKKLRYKYDQLFMQMNNISSTSNFNTERDKLIDSAVDKVLGQNTSDCDDVQNIIDIDLGE